MKYLDRKWDKVFRFVSEHAALMQLCLFIFLIVFQVLFSVNIVDIKFMIITAFIFIAIELLTIVCNTDHIRINQESKKELCPRSGNFITDLLTRNIDINRQKGEIYITGIGNHGLITKIVSDESFLNRCIEKNVKLNILFVNIEDTSMFTSLCKFYYGKEYTYAKEKVLKKQICTAIDYLNNDKRFKQITKNGNLEVRVTDNFISTAFIAYNPETIHGKMQCQFYQYGVPAFQCPSVVLSPSDKMYGCFCESLLDEWSVANLIQIEDLVVDRTASK